MSEAAELSVKISGKEVGIKALLSALEAALKKTDKESTKTTKGIGNDLDQAQIKAARSALQLAQAEARLAAAQGDAGTAATRLRSAIEANSAAGQRQVVAAQTQLTKLEQQAAATRQAGQSLEQLGGIARGVAAPIAAAFAVDSVVRFGSEAVTLANRTRDTKTALAALAGSPKLYAEALATAEQQQRKFGGTLAENVEGIQGLITVSRSSGVELQRLVDITQRLSIKDPAQGVSGARIALNEALAGDPTSLAKRYEIPRAALAKIRDESVSSSEKLAILDKYLNDIGITSEVASGGISRQTIAINTLNASAEAAKVALGDIISTAITPWAESAANALQGTANGLTAFSQIGSQQAQLNAQLIAGADGYAAYATSAQQVNQQITQQETLVTGLVAQLPVLTQTQYQLAQSLQQQGASAQAAVAAVTQYGGALSGLTENQQAYVTALVAGGTALDQAVAQTTALGPALSTIAATQRVLAEDTQLSSTQIADLGSRMTTLAAASAPMQDTIVNLSNLYRQGAISAEYLTSAITALEQQQLAEANAAAFAAQRAGERAVATTEATTATDEETVSLAQATEEKLKTAQAAQELAAFQEALASIAGQVAAGHLTAGDAALILAQKYGVASAEAERLINLQLQISRTAGVKAVAGIGGNIIKGFTSLYKSTNAAAQAQRDYNEAVGGSSVRLANLQSDLAKTKVGSEQYWKIRNDIARLEAQDAKGGRGGGGGRGGTSAADKELKAQQDLADKSEDLERDHQDRLAEITQEGAEKRREIEDEFAQHSLDSRADFYSSLIDMEDQALAQQLSARYEQIQQEAAEIARTQGADAAQAFEDAAVRGLEREGKREAEIKKAEESGDTGRAEALRGVAELEKKADDAKLARVREAGSELAAEQARQFADEEARFNEHATKLAETAQRNGLPLTGGLPTPDTPLGGPSSPLTGAAALPTMTAKDKEPKDNSPTPVIDVATPAAVDQQTSDLASKLDGVIAAIKENKAAIDGVKSEVASLKRSGAFKRD